METSLSMLQPPEGLEILQPLSHVQDEQVLLCRWTKDGVERLVAARHVTAEPGSRRDLLVRTASEHAAQLSHPNILSFYGLERSSSGLWLLSEPVDGPSLAQVVEERHRQHKALPAPTLIRLALPVCAALHHGHAEAKDVDGEPLHVPHGLLRPACVHISASGQVKVDDYWLGWVRARLDRRSIGAWSSPGMARREPPSAWSDLFSFGALLFELCTLEPLLWPDDAERSREALVDGSWAGRIDRIDAVELPPGLRAAVRRCLSASPHERFPDILAVGRELGRLAEALRAPARAPAAEVSPAPPAEVSAPEPTPTPAEASPAEPPPAPPPAAAPAPLDPDEAPDGPETARTQLIPERQALLPHRQPPDPPAEGSPLALAEDALLRWDGSSEGGEVADWWDTPPAEAPPEPPPAAPVDATPLEPELERAVRHPGPRILVAAVLIVLAAIWGYRRLAPDEVPFRLERMERRLGIGAEGDPEARMTRLERLAGKERSGNVSLRAEHLETELATVITQVEAALDLLERWSGPFPGPTAAPPVARLERLEHLLLGEVGAGGMTTREDHLMAVVEARAWMGALHARCLTMDCSLPPLPPPPEPTPPRRGRAAPPVAPVAPPLPPPPLGERTAGLPAALDREVAMVEALWASVVGATALPAEAPPAALESRLSLLSAALPRPPAQSPPPR